MTKELKSHHVGGFLSLKNALFIEYASEIQHTVDKALEGINILVDACIGSGKTTAIQYLCDKLPYNKKVLYLTYNRLLKIDAKSKIHKKNVMVTNYHGFAYSSLIKNGIKASVEDLIKTFNDSKPMIAKYDVLIIDEYQDIELDLSLMLNYIKSKNENLQIIAVGDMEQKIYDKTTLDVRQFINDYLGEYTKMSFTNCFRLSKELALKLGRIWNKPINGINTNCKISTMSVYDVTKFLSEQNPKDILCLGGRTGKMADVLNMLENKFPERFNKSTVYASITDKDSAGRTEPKSDSAIFTTFDSSKGLERKICVVFDYTESYWWARAGKSMQKYEILRNIFCVASSRGKDRIIFVDEGEAELSEESLSTPFETNDSFDDVGISDMFDFKYKEDIEDCYSLLKTTEISNVDRSIIDIKSADELIDLSPCIGTYQEVCYFNNKNIDKDINLVFQLNKDLSYDKREKKISTIDEKILYLTSLETKQQRYVNQVKPPFVSNEESDKIKKRLASFFSKDENVQVDCEIEFKKSSKSNDGFTALGFADVVKDDIVFELKFVSELSHEHFLQCACYMIALRIKKGILLNTRDNTMYEITIPNKKKFMNAVTKTITKGRIKRYYGHAL